MSRPRTCSRCSATSPAPGRCCPPWTGSTRPCPRLTQEGLLALFTEVAQVLSAESAVVMTSRVSFLEDSPQVRRLLDGTSLMSEKLAQQLHAQGVDPLRVPRFSVLRLRDDPAGGSLLARAAPAPGRHPGAQVTRRWQARPGPVTCADLLWWHITQVAGPELLPAGGRVLRAGLRARCHRVHPGRPGERARHRRVRRRARGRRPASGSVTCSGPPSPAGEAVAFRHVAYQEMLAAEFLRSPPDATPHSPPHGTPEADRARSASSCTTAARPPAMAAPAALQETAWCPPGCTWSGRVTT